MQKEDTRVLGRTLAIEEMKDVSGAKPTSPLADILTAPRADLTTYQEDSYSDIDNPQP